MKTSLVLASLAAFAAAAFPSPLRADEGDKEKSNAIKVNVSVTVQSEIPNYDKALKSPVPRLLELIYITDKNLIDYVGNYIAPDVIKTVGLEKVKDDFREWYIELYEHRGLEKVVIDRILFEGSRAFVHYTIVMKDGETNQEISPFILGEGDEWFLNDRDL
ncbi:MAG: hypothetical protein KDM91_00320 [Verrucomicrobiae bacterium]|nr:hypothetical protein [Verrucomicrobiae bacterium]MCP5550108.1 hypothetical protein [Akkermansiaceae bacterium]